MSASSIAAGGIYAIQSRLNRKGDDGAVTFNVRTCEPGGRFLASQRLAFVVLKLEFMEGLNGIETPSTRHVQVGAVLPPVVSMVPRGWI